MPVKELFKIPVPSEQGVKIALRLLDPEKGSEFGFTRVTESYMYRLFNTAVDRIKEQGGAGADQIEFAEIPEDVKELEIRILKNAEDLGIRSFDDRVKSGELKPLSLDPTKEIISVAPGPENALSLEDLRKSQKKFGKFGLKELVKAAVTLPGKAVKRIKAEASVVLQGKAPEEAIEHRVTCCTGVKTDGTIVSDPCEYLDVSKVDEGARDGHCEACGCPKDKTTRIARKATMPAYACPKHRWSTVKGVRLTKDGNDIQSESEIFETGDLDRFDNQGLPIDSSNGAEH